MQDTITVNLKIGTYHNLAKVEGKTFDDKINFLLSIVKVKKAKFCWYLDVEEYENIRLSQL